MKSMALWYTRKKELPAEAVSDISVDMHFNLWVDAIPTKNFLDIGIMFENLKNAQRINFFVPFIVKEEDLQDLGSIISESNLCNAIFNENYSVINHAVNKHVQVKNEQNDKVVFDLYALDVSKDIEFEYEYGGTILGIDTQVILNYTENKLPEEPECKHYIRFRILGAAISQHLIKRHKNKNNALESMISEKYALDLRFNYNRSLNASLLEAMNIGENKKVKMQKVHFLLMAKSDVDILTDGYKSARELEEGIWDRYIGVDNVSDIVAYHWKDEKKDDFLDSWEKFVKYKCDKCTWNTILISLIVLGLISVFFNTLSTILWEAFLGAFF